MNCGHHGIWGKGNGTRPQNMYDTSVKVPCIIGQPGRIAGDRVCDDLLSGYDIFPTLIEHAGLDEPAGPGKPGRSFAAVLRGEALDPEHGIVVYDEYGPVRMIRTRDWKYVDRHPDGPHELFHLAEDPGERVNRIDDPALANQLGDAPRPARRLVLRPRRPAPRCPDQGRHRLRPARPAGGRDGGAAVVRRQAPERRRLGPLARRRQSGPARA